MWARGLSFAAALTSAALHLEGELNAGCIRWWELLVVPEGLDEVEVVGGNSWEGKFASRSWRSCASWQAKAVLCLAVVLPCEKSAMPASAALLWVLDAQL